MFSRIVLRFIRRQIRYLNKEILFLFQYIYLNFDFSHNHEVAKKHDITRDKKQQLILQPVRTIAFFKWELEK